MASEEERVEGILEHLRDEGFSLEIRAVGNLGWEAGLVPLPPRDGPFVLRVRGAGATRLAAAEDALALYRERTAQR